MTQLYISSFSSVNADFELNKIQLKMAGITTPPCVIFFYEHTISVFPFMTGQLFGHNREWMGTDIITLCAKKYEIEIFNIQ